MHFCRGKGTLSEYYVLFIDVKIEKLYNLTHQLERQHGLVSVGEVGVHGHDDTVGDDGEDDAVLEGAAVDEPLHQPPDGVGGFEDEQAANKRDNYDLNE